jgi:DNA-binding beta-propeller fold protein YncE
MRVSVLCYSVLAMLVAAELSGCGGLPLGAESGAPQFGPQLSAAAKNPNLVYVSDAEARTVSVFSWPGKLLGTLTGFMQPVGLCSDANGNVYVVDSLASDIVEYAHNGAVPIKTLKDPRQRPLGCAVDPMTGNLAVTNSKTISSGPGSISLYAKAKGRPKIYSDVSVTEMLFCGYDNRGNLFADGYAKSSAFIFVELRKGGTTLSTIKVNPGIFAPGSVQWDGRYLTVTDTAAPEIDRLAISGSRAKIQGKTPLDGAATLVESWIAGKTVMAANIGPSNVLFWNYPAGGSPTRSLNGFTYPFGLTVSVPPTAKR